MRFQTLCEKHVVPLFAATAIITTAIPAAALPANQLCVKSLATPPTMDGYVGNAAVFPNDDPAWHGATQVAPQDAQGVPPTIMQSIFKFGSTETDVYVGGVFDQDLIRHADTLVVGIWIQPAAGGSPSGWKFVIRPFTISEEAAGAGSPDFLFNTRGLFTNGTRLASWWKGNGSTWNAANSATAVSNTAWLGDTAHFAFAREGANRWSFEMKIPRKSAADNDITKGVHFGSKGDTVKLYVNVLTTFVSGTAGDHSYQQYPWPAGTAINDSGDEVATLMPPEADWGSISLDTSGTCGISLTSSNIGVNRPPGSGTISGTLSTGLAPGQTFAASCTTEPTTPGFVTNRLIARPVSTQPAPVNDLQATFSVSQFGISSNWTTFTPPVATINPSSAVDITQDWSLSKQEACTIFKAWDHQCFKVDLASASGSGNILTPSVQRNLYWGPASAFSDDAVVDTKNLPPPKSGNQRILLQTFTSLLSAHDDAMLAEMGIRPPVCSATDPEASSTRCDCLLKGGTMCPSDPDWKGRPYQTLLRVVKSFLKTGKTISIDKTQYEEAQYLGSYSYLIRHFIDAPDAAAIDVGWNGELQAAGGALKPISLPHQKGLLIRGPDGRTVWSEPALYALEVPAGGAVMVTTKVSAKEGPKGSLGGDDNGGTPPPSVHPSCGRCAAAAGTASIRYSMLGWLLFAGVLALRQWRRRRGPTAR